MGGVCYFCYFQFQMFFSIRNLAGCVQLHYNLDKTKLVNISGKINHKRRNDDGGTVVQRLMRETAEPLTDAKVQGNER